MVNGNCPDWTCKEDLAGLPCGDPNNFNDRFLPELTDNTVVKACFGECTDDGSCMPSSISSLQVDNALFELVPTVATQFAEIKFGLQTRGQEKNLVVTNVSGQQIHKYNTRNEASYTLNLQEYASGVYIARVQVGNSVKAQKFIVQ